MGRPVSSKAGTHDQDHLDLVFLYALQALPPSEIAVVEAHMSACADCRQEMETLRPVVDSFVSWPIDVLRPSVPLWERLAQREDRCFGAFVGGDVVKAGPADGAEQDRFAPPRECERLFR